MINADEHKKLLARITKLEKNNVNYFDVEKEFFLIDSNNLSQVRPRLYGYSIQRNGIYEDDNLTPEAISGLRWARLLCLCRRSRRQNHD